MLQQTRCPIGIDASLTACAFMNTAGERFRIETAPADYPCFEARLHHMLQEAERALDWYVPALAAIEGFSMQSRSAQLSLERAGFGVALRHLLWERDIPFIVVPPSTLKKFATGDGFAEKNTVILHVFKKWAYTAADDNDADAYALSRFGEAFIEDVTQTFDRDFRSKVTYTYGRSTDRPPEPPRPKRSKRTVSRSRKAPAV